MRIAKAIAHAGLCSRRDAERWIEEGRVAVNGKRLETPAYVVKPGDKVSVDGKPLPVSRGAASLPLSQAEGARDQPQRPARAEDRLRGAAAGLATRDLGGTARSQHRGAPAAHHRWRARAASGAAEHRLAQALSRARVRHGHGGRSRPPRQGHERRRRGLRPGGGPDRPGARRQCLADAWACAKARTGR